MNRFYADRLRECFTGYLSALTAKQVEDYKVKRRAVVSPATVNPQAHVYESDGMELFEDDPPEVSQILEGTTWTLTLFDLGGNGFASGGVLASPQAYCSDSTEHGNEEIRDSRAQVAGHRFRGEDNRCIRQKTINP
jgi:hypothetical protein